MNTRTVRDTTLLLPGDERETLDAAGTPPHDGATVADRLISGDAWVRATLDRVTITRSHMINADLSSTHIIDNKWDRCVLRGCTLIGANLAGGMFKNIIFDNCRFDYAVLDHIRATGPVAFLGCALTETTFSHCTFNAVIFDGCKIAAALFDSTDLRGADLRGNDLSAVAGIPSLRGAIVSEEQIPDLTNALIHDLALT